MHSHTCSLMHTYSCSFLLHTCTLRYSHTHIPPYTHICPPYVLMHTYPVMHSLFSIFAPSSSPPHRLPHTHYSHITPTCSHTFILHLPGPEPPSARVPESLHCPKKVPGSPGLSANATACPTYPLCPAREAMDRPQCPAEPFFRAHRTDLF